MIPVNDIIPGNIYSQDDAQFLMGRGFTKEAAREAIREACRSGQLESRSWAGGKRRRRSAGTTDRRKAEKIAREWAKDLEEQYSVARVEIRLSVAIDSFITHCREGGLARTTVANYESRLGKFLSSVGDADLSEWMRDIACDIVSGYLRERAHEIRSPKHDRLVLPAFFNYLRYRRWYKGENPADAKLQGLRQPRGKLRKPKRRTTREEDLIMRRLGLAPWVLLQLRSLRPNRLPEDGKWPVWPRHPDTATEELQAFCDEYLTRRVSFNDLRATFTTERFERGLTPKQESMIVGHSAGVADRHYSDYQAMEARSKLPPDPLTEAGDDGRGDAAGDAEPGAKVAQR